MSHLGRYSDDFDLDDDGILRDSSSSPGFHIDDDGIYRDDLDFYKQHTTHWTDSGLGGDKQSSTSTLRYVDTLQSFDDDDGEDAYTHSLNISELEASRDNLTLDQSYVSRDDIADLDEYGILSLLDHDDHEEQGIMGTAELSQRSLGYDYTSDSHGTNFTGMSYDSYRPPNPDLKSVEPHRSNLLFSEHSTDDMDDDYYDQLKELGVLIEKEQEKEEAWDLDEFQQLEERVDERVQEAAGIHDQRNNRSSNKDAHLPSSPREFYDITLRQETFTEPMLDNPKPAANISLVDDDAASIDFNQSEQDEDVFYVASNHRSSPLRNVLSSYLGDTALSLPITSADNLSNNDDEVYRKCETDRPRSVSSTVSDFDVLSVDYERGLTESRRSNSSSSKPSSNRTQKFSKCKSEESFFEVESSSQKADSEKGGQKRVLPQLNLSLSSKEVSSSESFKLKSKSTSNISVKPGPVKPTHMSIREITDSLSGHDQLDQMNESQSISSAREEKHSKGELNECLQKESSKRKQATELVHQLQKDYDKLLSKYALAELTIDQMRLGVKINLYSDPAPPGQAFSGTLAPAQQAQCLSLSSVAQRGLMSASSPSFGNESIGTFSPMTASDDMYGSRISLVSTPDKADTGVTITPVPGSTPQMDMSSAGVNMGVDQAGIAMKVQNMKETLKADAIALNQRLDGFSNLLKENHLTVEEQEPIFEQLRQEHEKLRSDYLQAKEDSDILLRTCGAIPLLPNGFDDEKQLEGDVFRIGMKFDDIHEQVQNRLRTKTQRRPFQHQRSPLTIPGNGYLGGSQCNSPVVVAASPAPAVPSPSLPMTGPSALTTSPIILSTKQLSLPQIEKIDSALKADVSSREKSFTENRLEQLHRAYKGLMDKYRSLKETTQSRDRDVQIGKIAAKLKVVCMQEPDIFRLPAQLEKIAAGKKSGTSPRQLPDVRRLSQQQQSHEPKITSTEENQDTQTKSAADVSSKSRLVNVVNSPGPDGKMRNMSLMDSSRTDHRRQDRPLSDRPERPVSGQQLPNSPSSSEQQQPDQQELMQHAADSKGKELNGILQREPGRAKWREYEEYYVSDQDEDMDDEFAELPQPRRWRQKELDSKQKLELGSMSSLPDSGIYEPSAWSAMVTARSDVTGGHGDPTSEHRLSDTGVTTNSNGQPNIHRSLPRVQSAQKQSRRTIDVSPNSSRCSTPTQSISSSHTPARLKVTGSSQSNGSTMLNNRDSELGRSRGSSGQQTERVRKYPKAPRRSSDDSDRIAINKQPNQQNITHDSRQENTDQNRGPVTERVTLNNVIPSDRSNLVTPPAPSYNGATERKNAYQDGALNEKRLRGRPLSVRSNEEYDVESERQRRHSSVSVTSQSSSGTMTPPNKPSANSVRLRALHEEIEQLKAEVRQGEQTQSREESIHSSSDIITQSARDSMWYPAYWLNANNNGIHLPPGPVAAWLNPANGTTIPATATAVPGVTPTIPRMTPQTIPARNGRNSSEEEDNEHETETSDDNNQNSNRNINSRLTQRRYLQPSMITAPVRPAMIRPYSASVTEGQYYPNQHQHGYYYPVAPVPQPPPSNQPSQSDSDAAHTNQLYQYYVPTSYTQRHQQQLTGNGQNARTMQSGTVSNSQLVYGGVPYSRQGKYAHVDTDFTRQSNPSTRFAPSRVAYGPASARTSAGYSPLQVPPSARPHSACLASEMQTVPEQHLGNVSSVPVYGISPGAVPSTWLPSPSTIGQPYSGQTGSALCPMCGTQSQHTHTHYACQEHSDESDDTEVMGRPRSHSLSSPLLHARHSTPDQDRVRRYKYFPDDSDSDKDTRRYSHHSGSRRPSQTKHRSRRGWSSNSDSDNSSQSDPDLESSMHVAADAAKALDSLTRRMMSSVHGELAKTKRKPGIGSSQR